MGEDNLININELEEVEINEGEIKEKDSKIEEHEFLRKNREKKKKLEPTDDIIVDNLVESFALLSSMLDEAKKTKENIEKIHETVIDLLNAVTELKSVSEEFAKVNQIVKEINVLVKAISVNNSNIKELIDIIYKITEKQKTIESDVNSIKNEIFFTDIGEEKSSSKKTFNGGFLQLLNIAISGGILFIIIMFLIKHSS